MGEVWGGGGGRDCGQAAGNRWNHPAGCRKGSMQLPTPCAASPGRSAG
ncbi:hypothetical protein ACU4GD_11810 [Cupriavidus basilensis]